MSDLNLFHDAFDPLGLVAALVIGLLIGLERGWQDRDLPEGGRVAGLRTFALTGLLGGVLASLMPSFGPWPLAAGLIGLALLLAIFFREALRTSGNLSITSAVAMLLTLVLGALAVAGAIAAALAGAVIVAVLLNLKLTLHGWLRLIEHRELTAALQLLVLSVVILPYLPDAHFGPYDALNPYQLWWAVILIATLSLVGHFAMRATGSQRGILWTGILGGLASSTATTLTLSRYARQQPALADAAAAGIVSACGVMFLRLAVLTGAIQPALIPLFGLPLVLTGVAFLALGLRQWKKAGPATPATTSIEAMPPFDLGTALGFGAFLAVVAVLVPAAGAWLGESGIHALSALSGVADVDAIAISLARLHSDGQLGVGTTAVALSLAVLSNMLVKAAIAWTTGGILVGRKVAGAYAAGMLALLLSAGLRVAYADEAQDYQVQVQVLRQEDQFLTRASFRLPITTCEAYRYLTDYDAARKISGVTESVSTRLGPGRVRVERRAEETILMFRVRLHSVIDYTEHPYHGTEFAQVHGDSKVYRGRWQIQADGDASLLRFEGVLEPDSSLPMFVLQYFIKNKMLDRFTEMAHNGAARQGQPVAACL